MKKFLLVSLGLVLFSQVSFSQLQVGVRGGLNISNIIGKDVKNNGFKLGPHVGGFLRLHASDKIIIQPEVLFSMKGVSNNAGGSKWSQRLNYVDIPLMIGLKPTEGFGILLGVQPSLLVGAKQTVEFNSKKTSVTGTDGFNKFDFGAVAGLQFETKSGLDFGARFNYGFLDIFEKHNNLSENSVRNINMMVTLGYAFGGK